jgi:hypothetical protein
MPRRVPHSGLGYVLNWYSDVAGAKAAYQKAVESGHGNMAPMAALNLGSLLERLADTDTSQI